MASASSSKGKTRQTSAGPSAFLDGDDNRDFEYDLPYERKFRRPLSWAEDRKNVIAFLSPRGDRVPGRCKATGRPRRSYYRVTLPDDL
ncbi:hypothetical protein V8E54_007427 [Elaphomyces granulatus]